MPDAIQTFLRNLAAGATRRAETVSTSAWGRSRSFECFDLFDDTFVFEEGILDSLENKDSVVLVPKAALRRGGVGPDGARVFGPAAPKPIA